MLKLKSSLRENIGTSHTRRLRKEGFVPAIVYGKGKENQSVQVKHSDVIHAHDAGTLFHSVLQLDIDGKKERVIIKDVQRHPFKPLIQHIDFMYVNTNEKIVLNINIETQGDEAITKKGLIILNYISNIEVSCLPKNIPESIIVDVSSMDAGDKITLSEVSLPSGVSLVAIESDEEAADWPVLSIGYPDTQEPEETVAAEEETEEKADKE